MLDLSDVRFTKGVDFDFAPALALWRYSTCFGHQTALESRYGNGHPVAGVFTGNLANGGENIKLTLGPGTAIHEVNYYNKSPWPVQAGHSLVLEPLAPGTNHANPVSWKASGEVGGTPGIDETFVVSDPKVRITEFMAINSSSYKDSAGGSPDWVELFNPAGTPADLSGWALTDDPREPALWKFPENTVLEPGSRINVFASGRETFPAQELHAIFKLGGSKGGF